MNKFHLICFWSADGFQHQSWNHKALPQQMRSAVHIIIIHLNIIHVLARHPEPNLCSSIFTCSRKKALLKNTYMLIYYTFKMHLYVVSLPLILLSLSLPHVRGRTGHPAMPHQYAYWWNASPASPVLQSPRPEAMEAVANVTGYGRSC